MLGTKEKMYDLGWSEIEVRARYAIVSEPGFSKYSMTSYVRKSFLESVKQLHLFGVLHSNLEPRNVAKRWIETLVSISSRSLENTILTQVQTDIALARQTHLHRNLRQGTKKLILVSLTVACDMLLQCD